MNLNHEMKFESRKFRDTIVESVERDWRSIQEQMADELSVLKYYADRNWDYGMKAREILEKYKCLTQ